MTDRNEMGGLPGSPEDIVSDVLREDVGTTMSASAIHDVIARATKPVRSVAPLELALVLILTGVAILLGLSTAMNAGILSAQVSVRIVNRFAAISGAVEYLPIVVPILLLFAVDRTRRPAVTKTGPLQR